MLVGISRNFVDYKEKDRQGDVTENNGRLYVGLKKLEAPVHMYGANDPCGPYPKYQTYGDC